jgi:23S rRNA pseudouridine1911/1915/1917 synthase
MPPRLLRDWLQERYPQASLSTLRQMVRDRRVIVADSPAQRFDQPVGDDAAVRVLDRAGKKSPPPPIASSLHPLRLLHEDADLLVVEKPAGVLTSTGPRDRRPTALAIVRSYLAAEPRARAGLIHRLDKDASGLLVFSKNEQAFAHLKQQFFHHSVLRVYLAVTRRVPNPVRGRIEVRLIERADGTVHCVDADRGRESNADRGESAITEYATVRQEGGVAAVVVMLHTGRKHQIRVHLLGRAGGIVNDPLYPARSGKASSAPKEPDRLMLAALMLGFEHPRSGRWLQFDLPAPRAFPLVGGMAMPALVRESGLELKQQPGGSTPSTPSS